MQNAQSECVMSAVNMIFNQYERDRHMIILSKSSSSAGRVKVLFNWKKKLLSRPLVWLQGSSSLFPSFLVFLFRPSPLFPLL